MFFHKVESIDNEFSVKVSFYIFKGYPKALLIIFVQAALLPTCI